VGVGVRLRVMVDGSEERRVVDGEDVRRVRWGLVREREVEEDEDIVCVERES